MALAILSGFGLSTKTPLWGFLMRNEYTPLPPFRGFIARLRREVTLDF
jgi:hypothetical protein